MERYYFKNQIYCGDMYYHDRCKITPFYVGSVKCITCIHCKDYWNKLALIKGQMNNTGLWRYKERNLFKDKVGKPWIKCRVLHKSI